MVMIIKGIAQEFVFNKLETDSLILAENEHNNKENPNNNVAKNAT